MTFNVASSAWFTYASRAILSITCFWAVLSLNSAQAADFSVASTADSGAGSLRQAIQSLNTAGAGSHSITFDNSLGTIDLSSSLPSIDGTGMTVVINGFGTTLDGGDQHRLICVGGGDGTLQNLNLENGLAEGGEGGSGNGGAGNASNGGGGSSTTFVLGGEGGFGAGDGPLEVTEAMAATATAVRSSSVKEGLSRSLTPRSPLRRCQPAPAQSAD